MMSEQNGKQKLRSGSTGHNGLEHGKINDAFIHTLDHPQDHPVDIEATPYEAPKDTLDQEMKDGEPTNGPQKSSFMCCEPKGPEPGRIGFFQLFKYADKWDILMMILGSICMMALGCALPLNLLFFGDLLTKFVSYDATIRIRQAGMPLSNTTLSSTSSTASVCLAMQVSGSNFEVVTAAELQDVLLNTYVAAFISIGVGAFLLSALGMFLWTWTGDRQVHRIRNSFYAAVMRQDIGWFDVHEAGELNSRMVEDMERLSEGYGDKMATFVQWFATFIGGFTIGFVSGWKLTLVVIAASPLMILTTALLGKFMRTLVQRELAAYAKAGSVAEETFSNIRTVAAFGGEKKAEEKYGFNLQFALKEGVRKGTVGGATIGVFWMIIFSIFALTFWYGAKLTREENLAPGAILQVFFGVLVGSMALGQAAPLLENFATARGAAYAIFSVIEDSVRIDCSSEDGIRPESLDGNIEFHDVSFTYPARKEVQVLKGMSLVVSKGETVALVGESGCGKSTTIQLLQRYYDCERGQVTIDGKDLKDYNLKYLRNYMGIVSQEPVLFATTIAENIRLGGKVGYAEVTQEDIERAAKEANCYDFISCLPEGFDTLVGERGIQLSGGQKQRIAIARALVRNPSILLLDEATSALDTQSEKIVQETLDKASEGRTTIVIAHRLSTVKNANKIYAFKNGKIWESGTHAELMAKQGVYYGLCMRQLEKEKEEKEAMEKESRSYEPTSPTRLSPEHMQTSIRRSSSLRRSARAGSIRSLRSLTDTVNLAMGLDSPIDMLTENEDEVGEKVVGEDGLDAKNIDMSGIELLRMNRPEWGYMMLGCLAALVSGVIQPSFALLMSEIIGTLSECDPVKQEAGVARFVGFIILVGVGAAIASVVQHFFFGLSGEKMTVRLRKLAFAAIVKQEISYFDEKKNGVGSLISRLANDAALVKGATGIRIGTISQALVTMTAALVIAFVFVWELALAMVVFLPVMLATGKIQGIVTQGKNIKNKESIEEGGKMAQETISNIRTVTSLNRQRYFLDKFQHHFRIIHKEDAKKAQVFGIAYGVSQGMVYFMYALCFGLGGHLVICDCLPWRSEPIPFFHIFRVFAAVTFGGMAAGRATGSLADYGKAKLAAYSVKQILNRESAIDPKNVQGLEPESCEGNVKFQDVQFVYPSRKAVQVLNGLTLEIKKGEKLALVGSSGCGKSTTVSLLERFYDPQVGLVSIDQNSIQVLNVAWLRKNLGIVSQEPTLFDASIKENIAYGDNSRDVDFNEIIDAAKKSNIHEFISSLPLGYDTNVGPKGTQLSGGQKQRIAIARALVRNPSILLLDEATSALDMESEKVVQEALEKAMVGRTSIVIAHRLSTIKDADKIVVIDSGKVVEIGTHTSLLAKKGAYHALIHAQL